jgi:outer membrane protein assembly factor BamB
MMRTKHWSRIASWSLLVLVVGASSLFADSRDVLGKLGVQRGICVVLDDPRCELALPLAESSELTLYVQVRNDEERQAACRAADAAGVYGTRILVGSGDPARIHLAENLADALVAANGVSGFARAEVLRVLRPGGKALLGQEVLTKPFPDGADDWSHHYHGPDNNVQSNDRLARAPYVTQFIAEPHYGPAPQNVVASGGRVFMAFGHVAWKERAEPWLDTLVAVNGFNGTMLWKRKLTSGIMVDRSTMVATPSTLYLGDDKSCKLIDPATGEVTDQITIPTDLTGGTFWKWMALEDGVLYALVGEQEPLDRVARWRRTAGGWPWNAISEGYNAKDPSSFDTRTWKRTDSFDAKDHVWGFSKTLLAIDPTTKEVLWCHKEELPIDSRGLCMKDGRVYFCRFGKYLVCLDAKSGQEIWRRTVYKDPDLFKAIGPYCPYEHARTGWRSTIYLRCSDKALYFAGPEVFDVTAVSTEDGCHLWTYQAERNPHVLIRDDGVYVIGAGGLNADTHKLDPLTGEVLASYTISRAGCTRATGSVDSILFRGGGDGTIRLDPTSGTMQWISPMRPSCFGGTIVAGGHLYWIPWACDCNLQMFGVICCGPADDFKSDQAAKESERLQCGPAYGASGSLPSALDPPTSDDWPTYRADNTRTATTKAAVPDSVELLWTFTPQSAFEATPPVAAGGLVFLSGSDGIVRALDAADGKVRWTAYTGGAVRYPPAVADGRALVGSGDGYAYAFEAATGRLLWRFRAAPLERRIRVYNSLLSTWPVASGVLVHEGVAYCAAGINNYDGTHVYALDAASGKIKWQNNSTGAVGPTVGTGVAVQGDLLLDDGRLYLAGGSAASPAVFDIANGECLSPGQRGLRGRELHVTAGKNQRGEAQRRVEVVGQPLYATPENPVFERNKRLEWSDPVVKARNADLVCRQSQDGWKLVAQSSSANQDLWEQPLPSEPVRWAVAVDAQGRILVALRNGKVLCFGSVPRRNKTS